MSRISPEFILNGDKERFSGDSLFPLANVLNKNGWEFGEHVLSFCFSKKSCCSPQGVKAYAEIKPVRMANLTSSVRECMCSLFMMRSR